MQVELLDYLVFLGVVLIILLVDVWLVSKNNVTGQEPDGGHDFKTSLLYSIFCIVLSCFFGIWVYLRCGIDPTKEYFAAYFIEKSLSIDNIFFMIMIFDFLQVPRHAQHKVLFVGILSVLVFRAVMIMLGISIFAYFQWLLVIFGVLIAVSGVYAIRNANKTIEMKDSFVMTFVKKRFNFLESEANFFVTRIDGKLYVTRIFLALIAIEVADLTFALDSIPAVLSITSDKYIAYTSNILSVLGLRALYFLIAETIHKFRYLKYSLGSLMIFIGTKLIVAEFGYELSVDTSLYITLFILCIGFIPFPFKSNNK